MSEKRKSTANKIPFAENVDGDLLVCGVDDHDGGVFSFDLDDGGIGEKVSTSLASYLETYCKELLSGKLIYLEECGMVEKD